MKLHMGSYDLVVPGWLNTDISHQIWVSRVPKAAEILYRIGRLSEKQVMSHRRGVWKQVKYMNLAKPLPIPDCSVDAIYSSHVIEHLPREVTRRLFVECFRVLKPNGVIRTAVPDLDAIVAQHDKTNPDKTVASLFEEQPKLKDRHWWMYNEVSLDKALESAGFCDVTRREYQCGACPDLVAIEIRPESLFLEGFKPLKSVA